MAVSNVELIVNATKAVNPLRRVQQASLKVEQRLNKTNEAARKVAQGFQYMGNRAKRALRDAEQSAARLGQRMSGLRGTVGKAAIAFAAFKSVQTGIQRIESERRIKLLGKRFGEYAQLQEVATKAAQKFNLGQTEANQALADAFARLRPLGISLKDISSTFNGFRTAAVLGGATATEASAAFTQLAQALGSGTLRGDEFNSIAEQAPLVLQAISDETGVAAGQLREYAAEGLITSDVVINALKRIESEGADQLAEALDGPAAKIKEFQNATEEVQVALTNSVIPELSKSFVILADIINDLKPVIEGVGNFAATILGGIANTIERIRDPSKLASAVRKDQAEKLMAKGISLRRLTGSGMSNIPAISKEDEALLFGVKPAALPKGRTRLGALPSEKTSRGTKRTGKTDAEREAERQAENLRRQREQADAMLLSLKQEALLTGDITEQQRASLEHVIEKFNLARQFPDLSENELQILRNQLDTNFQLLEADKERIKQQELLEEAQRKAQEQERKRAEELRNLYQGIGDTISNGVVEALQGAVRGTTSLAEAATNMLNRLADQMFQLAINMLLFGNITGALGAGQGILGSLFGGFMANGGTVSGGKSYIVGERGPELFTPGRTGSIAPSGSFGEANVTINVDASGSSVEGKADQAAQLGKALSIAVQQELVKQKRPGGILAS